MNFKKLEVSGFKSFADKLQVSFSQGITAIVGPNGCGKSNVADSIRWVLGEQSAKLLRGSSMQDIIFNGTEKRKSLSYAEVALYFDNKERIFSLDYNEVVISRKLYRSGESEYFLNNSICRLKDIVNILRDSGIGREGYSIIGQGRIESLLSAKAEDRRAIFEEAAGISKHKSQKRESENKLERTSENIARLIDIRDEKQKHLEPISKQAQTARQYLELKEKLKDIEINIYLYQYDSAGKAKQIISDRLDKIVVNLQNVQSEYLTVSSEIEDIFNNISKYDVQQKHTNELLLNSMVELEKQYSDTRVYKEKQSNIESIIIRLEQDRSKLELERDENERNISSYELNIKESESKLQQCKSDLDSITVKYNEIVNDLMLDESESTKGQTDLLNVYDRLTDIKSNMSRLLAKRDGLVLHRQELEQDKNEIENNIVNSNDELLNQQIAYNTQNEHRESLLNELTQLEQNAKECMSKLSNISAQKDKATQDYHALEAKFKFASRVQQTNEWFGNTVKKLLNDVKDNEKVRNLIIGVVGQVIKVQPRYEVAIEIALGAAIQNIIVKDEMAAKEMIDYLKFNKYGRATFLPLSSVKSKTFDKSYSNLLFESGVCGVASELVSYDESLKKIASSLLGNTLIVENIDIGIDIAKKCGYSFKIVSLQGDVLSVFGAITGGAKHGDNVGILGHEREYAIIENRLSEVQQQLTIINQQKEEMAIAHGNSISSIENTTKDISNIDIKLAQNMQKIENLKTDIDKYHSTLNSFNIEIANIANGVIIVNQDIKNVEILEAAMAVDKHSTAENIQKRQANYNVKKEQRDILSEQISQLNILFAKIESEYNNNIEVVSLLQKRQKNINIDIEYTLTDIQDNKKLIEQYNKDIENILKQSEYKVVVNEHKIALANLENEKQILLDRQSIVDKHRTHLAEEIRKLSDCKTKEEIQLINVDNDIATMGQKILEEYELDYTQCLEYKHDVVLEKSVKEQIRIKKDINALGNINLNAIEESKSLFDSYNNYCLQIDDLEKAKYDLINIIKGLNKDMSETFNVEFEKIRSNFVKIFRELFNGGNADLVLQVNEGMTADERLDAGIDIVAQPPEKKLQTIALLSGGERAMTAIAILFAILKLKPMPFCVLDEIEAALDDANASRFAQYLQRFSKETQFIVITHRKPTMEMADSLYGVTMEEKGISKIVSVKLSDAVKVS